MVAAADIGSGAEGSRDLTAKTPKRQGRQEEMLFPLGALGVLASWRLLLNYGFSLPLGQLDLHEFAGFVSTEVLAEGQLVHHALYLLRLAGLGASDPLFICRGLCDLLIKDANASHVILVEN